MRIVGNGDVCCLQGWVVVDAMRWGGGLGGGGERCAWLDGVM